VTATDAQVRIAMRERQSKRTQEQAAAKANLRSRKTVAKYERLGKLPSQLKRPRTYRTRRDPFEADWPMLEEILTEAPELEAKSLFDWLCEAQPDKYEEGQLRTLQRRVGNWKVLHTEKELSLPQVREPGVSMQLDGTHMNKLGITIQGEPFPHILMHIVLPYSNWEWGRVAQSESLLAIQGAVSSALNELGHVPQELQVDNSSAATHDLRDQRQDGEGRAFNEGFLGFLEPLGMKPAKTHLQSPNENGDCEAAHGALKRCMEQHLLLRGSRDFETVAIYEEFVFNIMRRRNAMRRERLDHELAVMKPLKEALRSPVRQLRVRVSQAGTVRVLNRAYSVPSGLKGRHVKAIVTEWDVEFWYAGKCVRRVPRQTTHHGGIDYRHVVGSLLRKPGGFRNYRYFQALFPREVFRDTWEALKGWLPPRKADMGYLRILSLAATTLEEDVAAVLQALLAAAEPFDDETVRALTKPPRAQVPEIPPGTVDLAVYDRLLGLVPNR